MLMAEMSTDIESREPLVAALMWGVKHSVCISQLFVLQV